MTSGQPSHSDLPTGATGPAARLLGAGVVIGAYRVPSTGSTRRAVARPDEDAVTLAAEAAALALPESVGRVGTIILATTTPPYRLGGSVQALAEILGLQGDVFALELSTSLRDGLAAVRLAAALARPGRPVLVCAAHAGGGDASAGDGAVALLIGDADATLTGAVPLATLTPAASSAIELRDRWRLHREAVEREADRSFVQAIGTERLVRDTIATVPQQLRAPAVVVGPDARASAAAEKALDGPPDAVTRRTGSLGAAQPLLRLLAALDAPTLVVSVSNGLGEAVHVAPTDAGAAVATAVRDLAQSGGSEVDRAPATPLAADFDPYSSAPRAWRDRGVDFRLQGLIGGADGLEAPPGRRHPTGTVTAWTHDHVYPAAKSTELAIVKMDDGGQFYGQVAMGEHVAIHDRVELVPRRLHHGGGIIQYFWKVKPWR